MCRLNNFFLLIHWLCATNFSTDFLNFFFLFNIIFSWEFLYDSRTRMSKNFFLPNNDKFHWNNFYHTATYKSLWIFLFNFSFSFILCLYVNLFSPKSFSCVLLSRRKILFLFIQWKISSLFFYRVNLSFNAMRHHLGIWFINDLTIME